MRYEFQFETLEGRPLHVEKQPSPAGYSEFTLDRIPEGQQLRVRIYMDPWDLATGVNDPSAVLLLKR